MLFKSQFIFILNYYQKFTLLLYGRLLDSQIIARGLSLMCC